MKILIIQTAFIGDVILATAVLEKIHLHYPDAKIDFLLKKGNESLFSGHPFLGKIYILEKGDSKWRSLIQIIRSIRKESYQYIINLHRFFSSGIITILSGADYTIGFDKNPLSFLFSETHPHHISATNKDIHEINRNQSLIEKITDKNPMKPKLYPSSLDFDTVKPFLKHGPFICIFPASVWFTKQWPAEKWSALIAAFPEKYPIFILGSKQDIPLCTSIAQNAGHKNSAVLAGQLSLLQSAALMKYAVMNYVNDSAPLHLASAMNAPVTAIFCSTVPEFGFGPLSDLSFIAETNQNLSCRPCGLHGKKECPEGHFNCSDINISKLLSYIQFDPGR